MTVLLCEYVFNGLLDMLYSEGVAIQLVAMRRGKTSSKYYNSMSYILHTPIIHRK